MSAPGEENVADEPLPEPNDGGAAEPPDAVTIVRGSAVELPDAVTIVRGSAVELPDAVTIVGHQRAAPENVQATSAVRDGPGQGGLVGQVISGRYRVIELIATGGTSAVYLGQHVHMLKDVAIKVLDAQAERLPELVLRFQREAIVGAHLHHPNVASASDFGQLADGSYFLVLEHVRGVTLDQVIARGPVPWERACAIGVQLAEALGAAHDAGIVHRDVKPRNVLFVVGSSTFVKLIDFGFAQVRLATLLGPEAAATEAAAPASAKELTAAGMVLGTVAYMAPEAALGMPAVDERSDLYALGIILYELLTGHHPFDAVGPVELFLQQCNQPPPLMGLRAPSVTVPPRLEALVMKLLAKDPGARYQRASELVLALQAVVTEGDEPASGVASIPPLGARNAGTGAAGERRAPWRSLPRWSLISAGAAVVVAGIALAFGRSGAPVVEAERPEDRAAAAGSAETPARAESAGPVEGAAVGDPAAAGDPASSSAEAPGSSAEPVVGAEPRPREVALEVAGLDAWAWRMALRKAARDRDWGRGAESVRALLRLDPAALGEVDLQGAARAVTVGIEQVGGERSTKFFNALTNELGSGGIDVLYDVARNRATSKAGRWATEILRLPEVMARASPAVRVLFEFQESSCAAKRDLFGRMTDQGDRRALVELRALRTAECAARKDACCYRENAALASAIRTLGERLDTPPLK